ncbi:MAG: MBL fold metallo-hydrolase [Desulfatibacillaceae bacterium]
MKIKYYGVRGSVPAPGPQTIRYGGNTPCVAVWCGQELIILDAGTGLRILGDELMQTEFAKGKGKAAIFISHTHWDHIQGFPFFQPAYTKGNQIELHGVQQINKSLETAMHHQQQYQNFPVLLTQMPSKIYFSAIEDGEPLRIGAAVINNAELNHPGGCIGYRIDYNGKTVVYATDTEHYYNVDLRLLPLARGADLMIYDTTYTSEEYADHVGYGHSTPEQGIKLAREAGVKQLHLFHHHPNHSDEMLEAMLEKARKSFKETYLAQEGWEVEL